VQREGDSRSPLDNLRKALRIGIFERKQATVTLAVVGLNPKDAIELLDQKIQRALRTRSFELKVIFDNGPKMVRILEHFLANEKSVKAFSFAPVDAEQQPGVLSLDLQSA
jgi:dsDNA-specific endonuclease/ATPase MutS2